ncbi:MAG TPA: hypothetical protein VFE94_00440 [Candidatus Paceibacterota bacterium]|nr:hypothetical protein [Candidatus Paceibacterota bacterium]
MKISRIGQFLVLLVVLGTLVACAEASTADQENGDVSLAPGPIPATIDGCRRAVAALANHGTSTYDINLPVVDSQYRSFLAFVQEKRGIMPQISGWGIENSYVRPDGVAVVQYKVLGLYNTPDLWVQEQVAVVTFECVTRDITNPNFFPEVYALNGVDFRDFMESHNFPKPYYATLLGNMSWQ